MRRPLHAQVLVLFAVLVPVIIALLLFVASVVALLDARAHATHALAVATRAGSRRIEYLDYGDARTHFAPDAPEVVRDVFCQGLSLRTAGLADTPENIAAQVDVALGYGSPGSPWPSPFVPGRQHEYPTVAAQVSLPLRLLLFEVHLSVESETEVR